MVEYVVWLFVYTFLYHVFKILCFRFCFSFFSLLLLFSSSVFFMCRKAVPLKICAFRSNEQQQSNKKCCDVQLTYEKISCCGTNITRFLSFDLLFALWFPYHAHEHFHQASHMNLDHKHFTKQNHRNISYRMKRSRHLR